MKIVPASYEILYFNTEDLACIEKAARICYKSEGRIEPGSAEKIIRKLIESGHEAMLEHSRLTVKFIVDHGISHELVRHRLASFAQESTRYCNYSKDKFDNEITVVRPCFLDDSSTGKYNTWCRAMVACENAYFTMLEQGCTPQEARAVLPNSLKTEIVITANYREWRHILNLRAAGVTGKPHPQMVEVMVPLLAELQQKLPAVFGDIRISYDS